MVAARAVMGNYAKTKLKIRGSWWDPNGSVALAVKTVAVLVKIWRSLSGASFLISTDLLQRRPTEFIG